MAPITVPGRLPRPPSTQIANTRPMYSRPTDGSTGWMMIRNAPASDAVAIEIANAVRLMWVGLAAMSRKANWSWATAMMARPMNVRDKNTCNTMNINIEIMHGISMRLGRLTNPILIDWSI